MTHYILIIILYIPKQNMQLNFFKQKGIELRFPKLLNLSFNTLG